MGSEHHGKFFRRERFSGEHFGVRVHLEIGVLYKEGVRAFEKHYNLIVWDIIPS
jgi:hypothetical protein